MTGWLWRAGLAALLLGSTACAGKHLAQAPAGLDLTGTWQFSARETASLAETDSLAGPRGGERRQPGGGMIGGGMPGGRGGMPGGRGGFPGGRGQGGGGARRGGPGMMMAAPLERFTIEQRDSAVFFRFAPKEGVSVPTSWKATSTRFWPGEPEAELRARWTAEALVVERKLSPSAEGDLEGLGGRRGGGKVTETYSRARDSSRLIVTTDLGNGRKLRRVYELVPPPPH